MKYQSKIDSLVVGKLQAELLTAREDTALLNRWEKGQWLVGVSSTGEWQAMARLLLDPKTPVKGQRTASRLHRGFERRPVVRAAVRVRRSVNEKSHEA